MTCLRSECLKRRHALAVYCHHNCNCNSYFQNRNKKDKKTEKDRDLSNDRRERERSTSKKKSKDKDVKEKADKTTTLKVRHASKQEIVVEMGWGNISVLSFIDCLGTSCIFSQEGQIHGMLFIIKQV